MVIFVEPHSRVPLFFKMDAGFARWIDGMWEMTVMATGSALMNLTWLEQEDGHLSQIEINKVFCLVSHIGAEVAANYAMPCWIVFFVEFFFNVRSNVFFNVVLFKCLGGTVNSVLLHVLGHVSILDYGLAIRHLYKNNNKKKRLVKISLNRNKNNILK